MPVCSVSIQRNKLINLPFSVWIPLLEVGWTVFTFALAGAKTYPQMLALRFVVGLFEAGYWPALYYILGSWYNKRMPPHLYLWET